MIYHRMTSLHQETHNQLQKKPCFTENKGNLLLNEVIIDVTEHKNHNIFEIGVEVAVDINPVEALQLLSNLKKYKLNKLCVINLKEGP